MTFEDDCITLADPRGPPGTHAPGVQIFSFSCSFQQNILAHPLCELSPPQENSGSATDIDQVRWNSQLHQLIQNETFPCKSKWQSIVTESWKSHLLHPPCAGRRWNRVTGIIADWYYVTLSAIYSFIPYTSFRLNVFNGWSHNTQFCLNFLKTHPTFQSPKKSSSWVLNQVFSEFKKVPK